MLKFYKEYFSAFPGAEIFQGIFLAGSILFFVWVVYKALNRPKNYYKEQSELPLEDDDPLKF